MKKFLDVTLTSDFISGFCGETDEAHEDTLSLIKAVEYSFCYTYPYSLREVQNFIAYSTLTLVIKNRTFV